METNSQTSRRFSLACIAILVTALWLASTAHGQLKEDFTVDVGGGVYSLVAQPDGKILVAGTFTNIAGAAQAALARFNPDGTLDSAFKPQIQGFPDILSSQPDGKLLVGGVYMSNLPGQTIALGRLNSDGTLDSTFKAEVSGFVFALALQPDGKILVGGGLSRLPGAASTGLVCLNPDGSLDTSFNPAGLVNVVALTMQEDGKILLYDALNQMVRLNADGSRDASFNAEGDVHQTPCAVQSDGKILTIGIFELRRLQPDGKLDMVLAPGNSSPVRCLGVLTDGKLLIGGGFSDAQGVRLANLWRMNADGTLDTTFLPTDYDELSISALAVQADGNILVAGSGSKLGLKKSLITRLRNADPTTQILSFDGASATWLRSGCGPEIWRATFECSTNSSDWTTLGAGTRVAGGWRWTGTANLSPGSIV
ncbi:MAG TPA: hypothetical protein VEC99_11395, partial [Clostridia bacterium]|nr:hypothetical protein [Clostridia bacterium]